ncbi:MAG: hypothetical protein P4L40_24375 [Terracidiphilus sp.]|nr:hypothetical protein [Terracidiphilus sp.]
MIQSPRLDRYPANTLEGLIAREMSSMICECEDFEINLEPITDVISKFRALMGEAGWPATYQHVFLLQLRDDLTELTHGHPVTRQFYTLLTIELEFN